MPEWQCHIPEMPLPLAPKQPFHFDRNTPSTWAEIRTCGVAHVEGRSYHGMKRAFATDAEGSLAGASAQSGTTEETLRRIYRQPKPEERAALALQLDGLRRA